MELIYNFEKMKENFPIILELNKIPQDFEYHQEGSVGIHTQKVCDELIHLLEWRTLTKLEQETLYLAAFFHDIGKRDCTKTEQGKICSPYHAVKGAKLFRRLWYQEYNKIFPISFKTREEIANLIRFHGLPLLFMEKENIELTIRRAASLIDLNLLYLLAKADLYGRITKERNRMEEQLEYFKEFAQELGCFHSKPKFFNAYTKMKYLRGELNWYEDQLFEPPSFEVVLMMGYPLSGKDTYLEKHWNKDRIISLDDIREELNILPTEKSGKVVETAKERAKQYLRKKESFAWNATNLSYDIRTKLCQLFENYGARVTILYLETSYQELLMRNKQRERKVPEEVIHHMIKRIDMADPWEAYQVKYLET